MSRTRKNSLFIYGGLLLLMAAAAIVSFTRFSGAVFTLYGLFSLLVFVLVSSAFFLTSAFDKKECVFSKHSSAFLDKIYLSFSTPESRKGVLKKALSLVLLAIFLIRFYVSHDYLEEVVGLVSPLMNKAQTLLGVLLTNWQIGAMLFLVIYEFTSSKKFLASVRFVSLPVTALSVLFYPIFMLSICGEMTEGTFYLRAFLIALELGLSLGLEAETFTDELEKNKKDVAYAALLSVFLLLIDNIADYMPRNLFGESIGNLARPHDFNAFHRFFLYLSFILPAVYFVLLFPFDEKDRKAFLFFVAEATFFSYVSIRRIETFQHVENLPLHLCNTAMYIIPLTLLFHNYGLFYFTVFVNVIGAFLAMMMPNMPENNLAFASQTFEFFTNHMYAFFMPVLLMLLNIYERPKLKYYFYSMLSFLGYFILVIAINTYQTAINSPTDFFFLNSDYVVAKLGDWAKNIFRQTQTFTLNGLTFKTMWLYWFLYYLIYCGLSFVMWYVYEILFRSVDQLIYLTDANQRLRRDKQMYLLSKEESERSKKMNLEEIKKAEPSLKITSLFKKYRGETNDAVSDLSFSLKEGKIYGFLGKNGAGKSTTIKAIVGIHGYDQGKIEVCGYDVKFEPIEAKMCLGFVPDNYALYENLTGRQYINYIASIYRVEDKDKEERVSALLKRLEMEKAYDKPIGSYSHGMKQKITIISALVHQPKIWILDEPMTGLDPNSIFQIKEMMRDYVKQGNIVFFSSHIIDVVENICDEVIIINKGKFVERLDMNGDPEMRKGLEKEFLSVTEEGKKE
jgi:ABC-2 type transport system ATP-binding protein